MTYWGCIIYADVVCILVLMPIVFGRVNNTTNVTETLPPKINVYTDGEGDFKIPLKCRAKSYSNMTVCWYKNNILWNSCAKQKSGRIKTLWKNITIHSPNFEINDNFTCVAKNAYGKASDSYTVPCYEGTCLEWRSSQKKTINVGQDFPISCELVTTNKHINQCFQFGIKHHNQSYIKHVKITKLKTIVGQYPTFSIKYWYNIANAHINDTGVYSCYYNRKFLPENHCPELTTQQFNITVREHKTGNKNGKRRRIKIAIGVSLGTVLVVGLTLAVSLFCLRKRKLKSQRLYESNPEIRWDVFVSYSSKDFDWVKELCETLEKPPFNCTVCLHQRDWEVGRTILDNMAESVYCSYKTLLIVSKSYLESSFCVQELNMAVDCERTTQKLLKNRVILIKLDDVSLKNLPKTLRQKSYLDFSNDEQRKYYKTKLLKALLPRQELDEQSGNEQQSEESGNEELSEGSGDEAQCEISTNEAQFEGAENLECIPLHSIENPDC